MRRSLVLALVALLLVPAGVVGYQLAQVADAKGCPARLVPSEGPLRLRLFVENPVQLQYLDPGALSSYLASRFGRPVQVVGVEQTDETGFRLAAATRPFSEEFLVFLGYRTSFPNVQTSHGLVDALGFATPGTACAYVSFLPASKGMRCDLGSLLKPVQPSYAYAAHELGHLLGLAHTPGGIMGKGVFDLCGGDRFSPEQRAQVQRWGQA